MQTDPISMSDVMSVINKMNAVSYKQIESLDRVSKRLDNYSLATNNHFVALETRIKGIEALHNTDIENQKNRIGSLTQDAGHTTAVVTILAARCEIINTRCDTLATRYDNLASHNELVARALVAAALYPTILAAALFVYFSVYFS
jgi:peptide subunit release factor RF-3